MVGLPDNAVKEAKERVKNAILSAGCIFPVCARITVNMAPADKKKAGSGYDLALLMAVLAADGQVKEDVSDCCFIGELSLSGKLRPVSGVLSMVLSSRQAGIKRVFVAKENAPEASVVEGGSVYGVKDVSFYCILPMPCQIKCGRPVRHSYLYMHGLNTIGFCQRVEQRLFACYGSGVLRHKCLYAH